MAGKGWDYSGIYYPPGVDHVGALASSAQAADAYRHRQGVARQADSQLAMRRAEQALQRLEEARSPHERTRLAGLVERELADAEYAGARGDGTVSSTVAGQLASARAESERRVREAIARRQASRRRPPRASVPSTTGRTSQAPPGVARMDPSAAAYWRGLFPAQVHTELAQRASQLERSGYSPEMVQMTMREAVRAVRQARGEA